jgi:metal-responsive CopG/Arc/MetJ family transcriptional regulator
MKAELHDAIKRRALAERDECIRKLMTDESISDRELHFLRGKCCGIEAVMYSLERAVKERLEVMKRRRDKENGEIEPIGEAPSKNNR